MNRNFKRIFGLTMMIFMLSTTFVFAAEVEPAVSNADRFGLFTLIPPIVAIVLALFVLMDMLVDKGRKANPVDKKTDWYFKNEKYDKELV